MSDKNQANPTVGAQASQQKSPPSYVLLHPSDSPDLPVKYCIPMAEKSSTPERCSETASSKMFVKQPHQEKKLMKTITIASSAALLLALAAPTLGHAQSANPATLFNQANQMNNEEQDMAKELKSKAGDNQALITMADTIQEDHKANQAALEALASQKKVTLKSYEKNKAAQDQLDNLKGAQFNQSFSKNGHSRSREGSGFFSPGEERVLRRSRRPGIYR